MDESPDSALVRLARQGSVAACEALIRRYQDRVYSIVCGYVHDPEEALDITQDTFVRMVEGLPRFREQSSFYTWLYRIAVNRCIDRRRNRSRYPAPASFEEFESDRTLDLTERRAAHIVSDLERAGYLTKSRAGRRNRYEVDGAAKVRTPRMHTLTIAQLLALLLQALERQLG
ncbi:MAG: sigma-70 family RNA polymerase sigma factor [Massilia sp.]